MSVESLLQCLDQEIGRYHHKHEIIISELGENGKIEQGLRSFEYHQRQGKIWGAYENNVNEILRQLDEECSRAREKQPLLDRLRPDATFERNNIPNRLVIGSSQVSYEGFCERVPRVIDFPIPCPIFATDKTERRLCQLFLRILFSLPPGKVSFYNFDPHGLGKNMAGFAPLFGQKDIFPCGGAVCHEEEIKATLQALQKEAMNRLQSVLPGLRGCDSWVDYNEAMLRDGRTADMLDYKVIIFWGISEKLNRDVIQSVISLAEIGWAVGMLLVYSCDEVTIQSLAEHDLSRQTPLSTAEILQAAIHAEMNPYHHTMRTLIAQSVPIDRLFEKLGDDYAYQYLKISEVDEPVPSREHLWDILHEYKDRYAKYSSQGLDFEHLIQPESFWKETAVEQLAIPVGHFATGGTAVVGISGAPDPGRGIACHYLMGGGTGMGKSNLLHIIILSAMLRYSPEELTFYLLDLKDGVEFKAYGEGQLPHARLVALKADAEYGYSILEHLEKERMYRNKVLFRQANVEDYREYRKKNKLPRILLVIDEFQRLLENPNSMPLLINLVKLGRSSGIHLLLATQTIIGLDNFSNLQSQFGGRLVLKCFSEADSEILFGGYSSGNTEAVRLQTHHAILNTDSGRIEANKDFLIPKTLEAEERLKIAQQMARMAKERGLSASAPRVYDGDSPNNVPAREAFKSRASTCLTIGVHLDFENSPFSVSVESRTGENLLFCGNEKKVQRGIKEALLMSADSCSAFDEIDYIGSYDIKKSLGLAKDFLVYETLREFLETNQGSLSSIRRFLFLDNINVEREIGYRDRYYGKLPEGNAQKFSDYLERMNTEGNLLVAFYDTYGLFKNSGLTLERFRHTVGFGLSPAEYTQITDVPLLPKVSLQGRAVYGYNGELVIFRPFLESMV